MEEELAGELLQILQSETVRWKHEWLKTVTMLCLEYLSLDGLPDATRASQIPDEILDIVEKELDDSEKNDRTCSICGKPVFAGMTDECGSFYCHEGECFEKYMDANYGKGKWMALGNCEEDGCNGYYITTADVAGGYTGTGIFYTEWEDEE